MTATAIRLLTATHTTTRQRRQRRPATPAELARALDPNYRVTPAIRLISDLAVRSITQPGRRDVITTSPRTGKSELRAIYTPAWAWTRNPNLEFGVVSYADSLAQEHSRKLRRIVNDHADLLGYRISADKSAVGRWTIDGHTGGLLAVGVRSGITGRGLHHLIVDDPVKDQAEADSRAYREATYREFQSTLATRIHPGGSITIVQTRWHPADLAGRVIAAEPGRWTVTNIPAVADGTTPDALARPAGAAMTSALGFTADDYASLRRTVGERAWQALYQGNPQPAEGGLVKRAWLDTWRLDAAPTNPTRTIIAIDPSDSGSGDSCGIIAASLTRDNVIAIIADKSAPMTADQWATTAVTLATNLGASQITVEGFTARETYLAVLRKAWDRHTHQLGTPGRTIRITAWPPKGRARVGDAIARSAALLQALETGTTRVAGQLPAFEEAACAWQAGQHQPDSLAAAVIAHDELDTGRARRLGLSGVPGAPRNTFGPAAGITPLRRAEGW